MGVRATLVWSDPPAALSSSYLLMNNLDLSLTNIDNGVRIVGNQHLWEPELVGLVPPVSWLRLRACWFRSCGLHHARAVHVVDDSYVISVLALGHHKQRRTS